MDVVLEMFDTFLFDYLYAVTLPNKPTEGVLSSEVANGYNTTETLASASSYTYKPATSYFSIEPSKYAYMSRWPRDNVYRQAITLYLITW